jgi:lysophospholipase L1-like esterase
MKITTLLSLALLLLLSVASAADWPWAKYGLAPSTNPCCIPLKRTDWAEQYHTAMLAREKKPDLQLVFLGDSITMMWRSQSGYEGGTPVWEKYYAPRHAGNFGISGDRTEQLLWRITEGTDLDGLSPKVLVLMIGINNLLQSQNTPAQVAEGITTIVNYLKVKLPTTRILLLGDFPLWEKPTDPARQWVKDLNALIKPLGDSQRVWYLDVGPKLLEPDGTITKEKLRDLLHPSEKGYWIWAEAMEPYLVDLLEGEGKGEVWNKQP